MRFGFVVASRPTNTAHTSTATTWNTCMGLDGERYRQERGKPRQRGRRDLLSPVLTITLITTVSCHVGPVALCRCRQCILPLPADKAWAWLVRTRCPWFGRQTGRGVGQPRRVSKGASQAAAIWSGLREESLGMLSSALLSLSWCP